MKNGITRVDALVVVLTIAFVGAFGLAFLRKTRQSASVSGCYANLRQIGGGFETLRQSNSRDVPTEQKAQTPPNAVLIFQQLSSIMPRPSLLVCPADKGVVVGSWSTLSNGNVSYFVTDEPRAVSPVSIVAGDRNVGVRSGASTSSTNPAFAVWDGTKGMHGNRGYLLLGDTSVHDVDSAGLSNLVIRAPLTTVVIP